jgi:hypothetical protein
MGEYPALSEQDIAMIALQKLLLGYIPPSTCEQNLNIERLVTLT